MGRPPEEAEVRHLRELAWHGRGGSILRLGDEKCALLVALCDSWLAQGRVIEAADRYVATRKTPGYSAVQAAAAFNTLADALAAGGETETPPEAKA